MALFFIRSPHRPEPEPFPRRQVPFQSDLEQLKRESDRHRQIVEQLRDVKANYSLERHSFW